MTRVYVKSINTLHCIFFKTARILELSEKIFFYLTILSRIIRPREIIQIGLHFQFQYLGKYQKL